MEFLKPDNLNTVWASGGDRLFAGETKYATGWQVEIPPRQYFNYIDNKQDQALAHINQRGVAEWDAVTEYQAGKSYVQGSNGVIYKAINTSTNINPVEDGAGNWSVAFASNSDIPLVATTSQSVEMTDNTTFISPAKMVSAFTGLRRNTGSDGYQILPGNLIIQWCSSVITVPTAVGSTATATVTFPRAMTQLLSVMVTPDLGDTAESGEMSFGVFDKSATGASAKFVRVSGSNATGTETVRASFLVIGLAIV